MVTLCWHCDHRECSASFTTEAGARACADILKTRQQISGVMPLSEDGERLELNVPAAT